MAATTTAAPQAPQSIGAFGRIIGAIVNPRPTFEDIARKPNWLVPLLVLTLLNIGVAVIMGQRIDWMAVAHQRIEKVHFAAAQIEKLPPDQQQQAYNRQAMSAKFGVYIGGVLGTVILALILGGIYLGLFNLAGGGFTFQQSFSLVNYGLLPLGIKALLGIPIVLMKDPSAIDPQNFVASNLGAFLSPDAPLWKIGLASSVDVFVLWSVVLIALAYSAANPKKVSYGKALSITLGVYIAFTLLFTGIGAMFS
jgi:Yip1-like protein